MNEASLNVANVARVDHSLVDRCNIFPERLSSLPPVHVTVYQLPHLRYSDPVGYINVGPVGGVLSILKSELRNVAVFPARSVAIILICADDVSTEFTVRLNDPSLFVPVDMILSTHQNALMEYSICNAVGPKFASVPTDRVIVLYADQVCVCR